MPIYEIQEAVTNKGMHKSINALNPSSEKKQEQRNSNVELKYNYNVEMLSPFIIKVSQYVLTDS